jgi:Uma2 family endonuclease
MMAPERVTHNRSKLRVATALQDALVAAGLPCEVFTDGLAIKIDARTSYEPDASVVCGAPPSGDALTIDNPIIMVEVLSPSAAGIDHGRKLSGYFSVPERRTVSHSRSRPARRHSSQAGQWDAIETRVLTGGVARLDPPGLEVAVDARSR